MLQVSIAVTIQAYAQEVPDSNLSQATGYLDKRYRDSAQSTFK
jgi:hypothetical protein